MNRYLKYQNTMFNLTPNFNFQDFHFYNLNLKGIILYFPFKRKIYYTITTGFGCNETNAT